MWKRCEAAEQQAADKRQRKNAAKRGKQGVVQKAEESQKPKQDHLRQPRLELFVERIDGNLPPVIQHLTLMLHEAKRLMGGTAHGELSSTYVVGRILQKGLRCRSVSSPLPWFLKGRYPCHRLSPWYPCWLSLPLGWQRSSTSLARKLGNAGSSSIRPAAVALLPACMPDIPCNPGSTSLVNC